MLKGLFKKKEDNSPVELVAPLTGEAIELENVPDQVFSEKMMGDGIAIKPTDSKVVSPIDGEVYDVFETKHAISLRSDQGIELLIHMGLETVNLKGEGFEIMVSKGQKISKGSPLANFDIDKMKELEVETVTPIILLNGDNFKIDERKSNENVEAEQAGLLTISKK
ncbi:PTS sugar transporter subunit IIA [Aquibacillus sediminis]|uniref:PTS sugar transporter subunit IIA n=1 Tax=Aquibacillus sediminis TaxID=2574734 RepID=UPI00110936F1|nr:PTS glucose transporter subunit IIA [Aquibacillus sediminis]